MRHLAGALAATLTLWTGSAALAQPLPPPPAASIRSLIGQYGTPENIVTVYEKDGRLYAQGQGLDGAPLTQATGGLYTAGGAAPKAVLFDAPEQTAIAGGTRLPKRDFGAEVEAGIRQTVHADPAALRAAAMAATPPAETGKRASELVSLRRVPGVKFDIRYATANNFMGLPLYERAEAYLQRPAAEALTRVAASLKAKGYGLMIHDAYRPWFVTKMFWEATPEASRVFVADPAQGSRHNRGCAVDLTLYDLKTGKAVEMPSRYDEMSTRAYADFVGGASRQRALRDLLRREMEAQGFTVYPQEWWHFDYQDWAQYPIGTASFTALAGR